MAKKEITVIEGDSFDLGFTVSGTSGPVDFSSPGTELKAIILTLNGSQVLREFSIHDVDLPNGMFNIHLDAEETAALHGKYGWAVKYISGTKSITLAGGDLIARRY